MANAFARRLRRNLTVAERRLWLHLRRRGLGGFKFRRQHPLGPYVADFTCLEAHLIVEVDGGQHAESGSDAERTTWFETRGFRVLRFWNNEVLANTEGVLSVIQKVLEERQPPPRPSPPQAGEGDLSAGAYQAPSPLTILPKVIYLVFE